jgi:hypothetical protein
MPPRLHLYKLTHDGGAAPCVDGDLLTLAICKPRIRATAQVGDLIFGFAANSLSSDNRLIYIARVTAAENHGDYYEKATYRQRFDCIYDRGADRRFRLRPDARFHEDGSQLQRDLGAFPEYESSRVLVSKDFRYFGSSGNPPAAQPGLYPAVRALLRRLGQGHRVNHPAALQRELWQLQRSAWSGPPAKRVHAPHTPPGSTTGERAAATARRTCS